MMNLQKLLSTALVLFLTLTLFSCSKDDEEVSEANIIGVWTVQSADVTINGMSMDSYIEDAIKDMKEQMGDSYSDEIGEAFAEAFEGFDASTEFANTSFDFQSDNKFYYKEDGTTSEEGTWSLSDRMITVTIDGDPETAEVRSIKGNTATFVFSDEEDIQGETIKTELILNVNK